MTNIFRLHLAGVRRIALLVAGDIYKLAPKDDLAMANTASAGESSVAKTGFSRLDQV